MISSVRLKWAFDLDNTLCYTHDSYEKVVPIPEMIAKVNELYEEGHSILIYTARGVSSGIDWTELTKKQLKEWGVKYNKLSVGEKAGFDILVDDKAIHPSDFKKMYIDKKVVGFCGSTFDLIHPGYIKMFQDAKTVCNYLVAGLQTDPTIDRPNKNKPVQTTEERRMVLEAIKYVDEVVEYTTEVELVALLKNLKPDVRILGTDWQGKPFTGDDLPIKIYWHTRDHDWSTSNLRTKIEQAASSRNKKDGRQP